MTRPIASSLGQTTAQMLRALQGCLPEVGSSRLSSPERAAASGSAAVARPGAPERRLVSLTMAAHLLTQPVGDRAGQLGDLGRVDPARSRDGHGELVDDPAGA